ncbi:hypothetical protein VTI74DRAFT_5399 [Chaetomium olivicolor]
MPTLVAIDVCVVDDRIRLVFSDRAVAVAYAAYLRAQDLRSPHHQAIPGYQRAPQLHTTTKEVSLSLPAFITWFITCRLPDDEDSVTFTFVDEHAEHASRWAESMVLFEPVPQQNAGDGNDNVEDSSSYFVKQMHVRRLWNRAHLLKRLEELRRMAMTPTVRSRVGSPVWGSNGLNGNGGDKVQVPLTVPTGRMQRGDIWW